MPRFIEPIILNGIDKDVSPNGLDYSGRRVINPIRDVLNMRYFSSESDNEYEAESIRGTEEVTNPEIFKLLTLNGGFTGSLDGWEEITLPSGISWSYNSNAARISGSVDAVTNALVQAININSGKNASINCRATIISGIVPSVDIYGYFFDNDDNVIESFSVLFLSTVIAGQSSKTVTISKLVPPGTAKVGFAADVNTSGAYVVEVTTFNVSGYQTLDLPDGLNECIGTYENIEKNLLIYFIWNSNGYHGVFKYDASDDTITQLLADDPSDPVLNFSNNPRYAITGVGMIGDILSWTDNLNPQRYINITRDYSLSNNDFTISLIKIGPRNKPTFIEKSSISPSEYNNKLAVDSIQVAHRYIYMDNEVSVLSPYSDLIVAEAYGIDRIFLNIRNKVTITFPIDTDLSPLVRRVELLYRIGNSADWRIFNHYESFGSSIVEEFSNGSFGEPIPISQSAKLFDSIPNKSKALIILKNRIFLNINEEGMEVPDITITPSLGEDLDTSDVPTNGSGGYIKKNGYTEVAIVASDKFGRFTGAYAKAKLLGKNYEMGYPNVIFPATDPDNIIGNRMNVDISGLVPEGSRYSIVMKPELKYETYFQTWAMLQMYIREAADHPANTSQFEYRGHVYQERLAGEDYPVADMIFPFIHWILPLNTPIVIDTTFYVRILNGDGSVHSTERVLDVLGGNIIVTGKFDLQLLKTRYLFIEIFKLKEVSDVFFYEVSGPFESSGTSPNTTNIENIKGDTFYRGAYGDALSPDHDSDVNYKAFVFPPDVPYPFGAPKVDAPTQVESPTPTYSIGFPGNTELSFLAPVSTGNIAEKQYSLDYAKSAWGRGRTFVETQAQVIHRPATIRFSDVYVEDSKINGLNSFPVENIYDKVGQDRSAIVKFISVGNVLVAVHERHTTTIYIGEGIIRAGETGFLAKSDSVIGDDRKLIGDYGSYHPESVCEIDGAAFGFDIFSGVVWRYTVEGQLSISDFGMKNFFRDKSSQYFEFKDILKFVGVIDKYNKEYLITLPNKYSTLDAPDLLEFSGSDGFYDLELDPDEYVQGETYRLKIVPFLQSETDSDNVSFVASKEGTTPVNTEIIQNVTTYVEADATAIYIEFVYTGEDFIRLSLTNIDQPIYVRLTSEYQEIKGETWAFNYEKKRWVCRYSFVPEFMGKVGNKLFSFKNGRLFKHNVSDTYNNFYGIQYARKCTVACNPQPNKVKVWSAIQIAAESLCTTETSTFQVMQCENEDGQESYTMAKDFEKKEGIYYAPILKDVNTNAALISAGRIALRDGKDMRSKSIEITINNNRTDKSLLQKLNIIGEFSEFSV